MSQLSRSAFFKIIFFIIYVFFMSDYIGAVAQTYRNVGRWSDKGCHVEEDDELTVECRCDHLTNFAILMQVKEFEVSLDFFNGRKRQLLSSEI